MVSLEVSAIFSSRCKIAITDTTSSIRSRKVFGFVGTACKVSRSSIFALVAEATKTLKVAEELVLLAMDSEVGAMLALATNHNDSSH